MARTSCPRDPQAVGQREHRRDVAAAGPRHEQDAAHGRNLPGARRGRLPAWVPPRSTPRPAAASSTWPTDLTPDQEAAPLPPDPAVDRRRRLPAPHRGVLRRARRQHAAGPARDAAAWTAAQLAGRADLDARPGVRAVGRRAPRSSTRRSRRPGRAMGFVALDAWTHEQDIRAASGVGALHDDALAPRASSTSPSGPWAASTPARAARRCASCSTARSTRTGDGDPTATLVTTRLRAHADGVRAPQRSPDRSRRLVRRRGAGGAGGDHTSSRPSRGSRRLTTSVTTWR